MVLTFWYQEGIPPEINWVFGFLGVIAFVLGVLATPSALQMMVVKHISNGNTKRSLTEQTERFLCFSAIRL